MEIILTSVLAFVATNIDDLFLLTLFFGNRHYHSRGIILGQLLGIGVLIVLGLAGSFIGELIKPAYIGLLGIFPIYLGVAQYVKFFKGREEDEDSPRALKSGNMILGVAIITIANGGDNLGIYIPLFVPLSVMNKGIMIIIFFIMTLLWCFMAKYLANHALLKKSLEKYGHVVTPAVLILLGFYILYENNTLAW